MENKIIVSILLILLTGCFSENSKSLSNKDDLSFESSIINVNDYLVLDSWAKINSNIHDFSFSYPDNCYYMYSSFDGVVVETISNINLKQNYYYMWEYNSGSFDELLEFYEELKGEILEDTNSDTIEVGKIEILKDSKLYYSIIRSYYCNFEERERKRLLVFIDKLTLSYDSELGRFDQSLEEFYSILNSIVEKTEI